MSETPFAPCLAGVHRNTKPSPTKLLPPVASTPQVAKWQHLQSPCNMPYHRISPSSLTDRADDARDQSKNLVQCSTFVVACESLATYEVHEEYDRPRLAVSLDRRRTSQRSPSATRSCSNSILPRRESSTVSVSTSDLRTGGRSASVGHRTPLDRSTSPSFYDGGNRLVGTLLERTMIERTIARHWAMMHRVQ